MHLAECIVFLLSAAILLIAGLVSVLQDLLGRSPHEAPRLIGTRCIDADGPAGALECQRIPESGH